MIRLAAAVVVALGAAAPAMALDLKSVTAFNQTLMYQIYTSQRAEANSLIADSTVLARVGDIDAEMKEKLPFATDVVLHFAPDGDLLAWSDESGVVEAGYWELIGADFNELCIRFGSFGLISLCASPDIAASDWIIEGTPGNPFGLVAGEAVPAALGADSLSLNGIAARVQ